MMRKRSFGILGLLACATMPFVFVPAASASTTQAVDLSINQATFDHFRQLDAQAASSSNGHMPISVQSMLSALGLSSNDWGNAKLQLSLPSGSNQDPITGHLVTPSATLNVTLNSVDSTNLSSPKGTIVNIDASGQITNANGTTNDVQVGIDFIPGTNNCQASLTIDGAGSPVAEFFGTPFLTQSEMQQALKPNSTAPLSSQTTNSQSVQTNAASSPMTSSSNPWYFQGNNAIQTLDGGQYNIGNWTVDIGGSDYFNGISTGVERLEIWGTKAAENWLMTTYNGNTGYGSSGVYTAIVAVDNPQQYGITFTGATSIPASGSTYITIWSWLLGYVPYVGGALQAFANALDVGAVTIPPFSLYFVQTNFNNVGADYVIPTNVNYNQAEGRYSYSQQFGFNGSPGLQITLEGYVKYMTFVVTDPTTGSGYAAYDSTPDVSMTPATQYQPGYTG